MMYDANSKVIKKEGQESLGKTLRKGVAKNKES